MALSQLSIFGAGLIGGSIAHAARQAQLAERLVAIDQNPAPTSGSPFDQWVDAGSDEAVKAALKGSDLTILCVPVGAITQLLPSVISRTPGVVTDCGSTKGAICQSVVDHPGRARFVAGHPMAGHPEGGLKNARADLFADRKWILCPEGASNEAEILVRDFVTGLGATALRLDANEHDRSVAITSHVPQVVASALSVFAEEEDAKQAAGPGFASATRVAGGAEAMWGDIFETNGPAIGAALSDVGGQLQTLGEQLRTGDRSGALETLEKARKLRGD
jgi:prephenate dehydrogenase